ncbi:MAG: hypothetical protein AAF202_11365, partial [Pseudomonadota bacterium]
LNQLLSLALAEPLPGVQNASEALERIVKTPGLIVELTRLIPVGMLGPMSLRGDHFARLLIENELGALTVEPEIKEYLRRQKQRIKAHVDSQTNSPDRATGISCPMAGCEQDDEGDQFTGLVLLAEAYLHVYRALENSPLFQD